METSERVQYSLRGHSILLAEDNEDEVFMMRRAFAKAHIENPLHTVGNGEQALDYLEGRGDFIDRATHPFPAIMFLDLNMPRLGGLEVLDYVRQRPHLCRVKINILSSSIRAADIDQARLLGASSYFLKPTRLEKFQELIQEWYNLTRFEAFPQ